MRKSHEELRLGVEERLGMVLKSGRGCMRAYLEALWRSSSCSFWLSRIVSDVSNFICEGRHAARRET